MVREGRLRNHLFDSDLGFDFIRGIYRDDGDPAAQSLPCLELREHGHLQCLGLSCHRVPHANNVLGSGSW